MTMLTADTAPAAAPAAAPAPAAAAAVPAAAPAAPAPAAPAPASPTPAEPGAASPAADGTAEPAAKPAVDVAPEKYADFAKPAGVETLDPAVVAEVSALAKELNLTQEKAQRVLDARLSQSAAYVNTQVETIAALHIEWQGQVKVDKEIGGDKLAENLAAANAAMKATSTPQLIALLDKSGLGNHPEVIRHFFKIAPAFAEGRHVPGGKAPTGDSKSHANVLYPTAA